MRAWVYNRIKAAAGVPAAFGSGSAMRVISSGAAVTPQKPFLILQMGVEDAPLGSVSEERTQQVPFTVWVHDEPGSMLNIDDAAIALKNALPTEAGAVAGSLSIYRVKWEGTGEDAYDDHFKTNTRPVRFSAMTRRAG